MLRDGREHGTSVETMVSVRSERAFCETECAKDVLRRSRGRLGDGDTIALPGAILDALGDQSFGDTPTSGCFCYAE